MLLLLFLIGSNIFKITDNKTLMPRKSGGTRLIFISIYATRGSVVGVIWFFEKQVLDRWRCLP